MNHSGLTVALALGGGGARGLAHISVLEILDELGVRPVAIAGTSIGAVIGVAYAAGHSGAALRQHTERLLRNKVRLTRRLLHARARRRRRFLIDFAHPVLIDGQRFLDAFWPLDMPTRFEELKIPCRVIATDFEQRREIVFTHGPLRSAVAGSMAIPGLVQAVASEHGYLIDGGVVNPLPYNHLKGLADIIVAVDLAGVVSVKPGRKGPPSPGETLVVASQMMVNGVTARMLRDHPPDVHIAPAVNHFMATDIFKYSRILAAGDACRDEFIARFDAAAARVRRQRLA
jgi:NTE family protein